MVALGLKAVVINREVILLFSVILFCLGLIGIIGQKRIIKIIISIEIMVFASLVNFCCFAGGKSIKSGHFAALIAVILSGLTISVIYTLMTKQSKKPHIVISLSENQGNEHV